MPRNGSGTYTLSDTIANATTADASELQAILNDIATALTGSMAADGQTPITGQMLGLVSTNPAWSFVADTNTGFGSDSADECWAKTNGTERLTINTTGVAVTGTLNTTGAATIGAALTVTTGGLTVTAGGIGVTGNGAINGTFTTGAVTCTTIAASGAITGSSTVSGTDITASGALSGATVAGSMVATQAQQETGTATTALVSPGRQHFHPSAAKAWAHFSGTTGTMNANFNVTSVTRTGNGSYDVVIATDFSSAAYAVVVTHISDLALSSQVASTGYAAGAFHIGVVTTATGAATDAVSVSFICFGDQA